MLDTIRAILDDAIAVSSDFVGPDHQESLRNTAAEIGREKVEIARREAVCVGEAEVTRGRDCLERLPGSDIQRHRARNRQAPPEDQDHRSCILALTSPPESPDHSEGNSPSVAPIVVKSRNRATIISNLFMHHLCSRLQPTGNVALGASAVGLAITSWHA